MIKLAKLNDKPEIFYSIQGEGKNIGKPSVFIRLSLCNLYCIWCDTDYTWNWVGTSFKHVNDTFKNYKKFNKKDLIVSLPNNDILSILSQFHCNNIVITGGEPFVQQKDLISLLTTMKNHNKNYHIEFETNGTLLPSLEIDSLINQYNVSLKLSNSKVNFNDRINPKSIDFFANSQKSNFKFVIDSQEDLNEVLELLSKYNIKNTDVFLMPQGATVLGLKQKQNWLVELCKKYNFNYTDRLHIHIWGDKRGI
jgi:organic radical activating enzyme